MSAETISLDGGKYVIENKNGNLNFLRNGEVWASANNDLKYSKVIMSMFDRIHSLENKATPVADSIAALQAKLDAVMLEYCPEKMSKDQISNWGKHQTNSMDVKSAMTTIAQLAKLSESASSLPERLNETGQFLGQKMR